MESKIFFGSFLNCVLRFSRGTFLSIYTDFIEFLDKACSGCFLTVLTSPVSGAQDRLGLVGMRRTDGQGHF